MAQSINQAQSLILKRSCEFFKRWYSHFIAHCIDHLFLLRYNYNERSKYLTYLSNLINNKNVDRGIFQHSAVALFFGYISREKFN